MRLLEQVIVLEILFANRICQSQPCPLRALSAQRAASDQYRRARQVHRGDEINATGDA